MMKSFFKKLAFVMALAMVVSMVAPAGAVYAATEGISLKGVVYEEYALDVEESVDFAFAGYEGYTKTTPVKWESSDETVATVDKGGIVTGLKDGVTTITVTVNNTWVKSMVVTVGEGAAEEEVPEVTGDFTVEMVSDHSVRIYTDLELTLDNLLYYYFEEGQMVEVPLVQSVKEVEEGCWEAKMYDGVLFADGTTYGFAYGEASDEFDCVYGDITRAELTLDGKVVSEVELNSDEKDHYELGVVIYDTYNTDITATAMADGVYPIYEVSEDEDYRYTSVELDNGMGIAFYEQSAAVVKVSVAVADEETEEEVVLVGPSANVIKGVTPEAYKVLLNTSATYTITETPLTVNFSKAADINKKLAVGDEGYTLLLKLKDNKGKEVATSGNYVTTYSTIDTATEYAKGTFSFKSTNVGRLYVTNSGELMPNAAGKVSVLVYFTPAPVDEDDTPKASLVSVVNVNVEPARKVDKVTATIDKSTISTKDVNDANEATITVEVRDSLGEKVGVEGVTVTIEPTTKLADLKNAKYLPTLDKTTATVTGGKVTFTVSATPGIFAEAGNLSESFNYEIKVGNRTKTEKVSVKVSSPDAEKISGTTLIFGNAKEIKDGTGVASIKLPVSLAGISNKVASKLLPIAGPKVKASETVKGNYYYTVTKDNVDITDKATIEVDGNGVLWIDITNEKDFLYSEYAGAATKDATQVDLLHGAGTYKVTVVKSEGTTFNSKKATGTYTVANKLPSIDTEVTKINPTYAVTDDIAEVVKNCFKFKIGTVEFDEDEDYGNTYHIAVDANFVAEGEVVFVNTVTFYKNSEAEGIWINCGTVDVYDYITLVDEE